jgi:hypothetical protein
LSSAAGLFNLRSNDFYRPFFEIFLPESQADWNSLFVRRSVKNSYQAGGRSPLILCLYRERFDKRFVERAGKRQDWLTEAKIVTALSKKHPAITDSRSGVHR